MVIVSFSLFATSISADELNFSVNTVVPSNQIDKEKTYFNLKMIPNQKQDVTVTLKNNTKKDITINIGINTAKTNANGVIEYGNSTIKNDSSLKHALSDIVKGPDSIVVPANSAKDVVYHITMPEENFDGIILGGLTFQQKSSEVKQDIKNKGTAITNEYAYAVAMLLQETDKKIMPNLHLLDVKPSQSNGRNVINATVQNDQPAMLSQVKVDAKIYAKGSNKPVYTAIKNDLQIAPNSSFQYPISLEGTRMQAGDYTLKMTVTGTSQKETKTWQFKKDFKIKAAEARELNKTDVDVKANTNTFPWMYLILAILLIVIISLIIIVIVMKKKHN